MVHPLRAAVPLFDHLASEDGNALRHEYVGGRVYAMTGGAMRHNRIAGNLHARLLASLDGTPCQVFINDIKLHVQAHQRAADGRWTAPAYTAADTVPEVLPGLGALALGALYAGTDRA